MVKSEASGTARERGGERPAATLDELVVLRRASPAWRLLAADSAPAVIAFLDRAFLSAGNRTVPEAELASVLTVVLEQVNAADGPAAMPKAARDYLSDWCGDGFGWLRRYYAAGSDEPVYDITPRVEAAVTWVKELSRSRAFIGTQSRLLQVIDLLDQIAEGVQHDPTERIRILEQRRAEIDEQIEAARVGRLQTLGPGEVRDRYQTLADLARSLLADFRHVEENFRTLDRQTREQVAQWTGPRGQLLDQVLGQRHFITEGETGASFTGFYDVLFDPSRWENLQGLLSTVAAMPEVSGVDDELPGITRDWLRGADQVQRTVARLSAQMRRFLEEQAYADNRRIGSLVHSIEANAVRVRDDQPRRHDFMSLDEPRADVGLPMDRTLWTPPVRQQFSDPKPVEPPSEAEIETMDELFAGQHVDAERVRAVLAATLSLFPAGLSVKEAVELEPLTEGLAELVTLLEVATDAEWLGEAVESLGEPVPEQIVLVEPERTRVATVPRMLLTDDDGEVEGDDFG
jgi:hypothetical protein